MARNAESKRLQRFQARLSSDGRIVIPAPLREQMGVEDGDSVEVYVRRYEDMVSMIDAGAGEEQTEVVAESTL